MCQWQIARWRTTGQGRPGRRPAPRTVARLTPCLATASAREASAAYIPWQDQLFLTAACSQRSGTRVLQLRPASTTTHAMNALPQTASSDIPDPLVIAGHTFRSRLLTGTGKFKDLDET